MITQTLSLKEQIQNRSKIDQIIRSHDVMRATKKAKLNDSFMVIIVGIKTRSIWRYYN